MISERDLAMQTLDGTLPYEESWRENATNVLHLLNEVERLRGERFDTSNVQIRDLGRLAVEGLTVMRDEDEDDWVLPDLQTINRAIAAVSALVSHAEDRQRFKRALTRIGKEWMDRCASSDDVREYARLVLAGGSARVPLVQSRGVEASRGRHGHAWNAQQCACGATLVGCHGCCELRCVTCAPYTDYERLNRCCTVLASTESLESNPLAEKEGFEPSFPAKRHGNRLGFPSALRRHGK